VEDSAALARLRQRFRKNTFEIPLPTFADLYRNQVCLSPCDPLSSGADHSL